MLSGTRTFSAFDQTKESLWWLQEQSLAEIKPPNNCDKEVVFDVENETAYKSSPVDTVCTHVPM